MSLLRKSSFSDHFHICGNIYYEEQNKFSYFSVVYSTALSLFHSVELKIDD
jgi:hypothetical protein